MKTNRIRTWLCGLSFASALFAFQACYGTPRDLEPDLLIEGQVKSGTSGLPVKGIRVTVLQSNQYQMTDADGKFSLYTGMSESLNLRFEDVDSVQNGAFFNKDTVLTNIPERVFLDIRLEEK